VAQRGLFDVKISQQEEEASRAFQAAETGVEAALRTLAGTGEIDLGGGAGYSVSVAGEGGNGFVTGPVKAGDAVAIDLTGATGVTGANVYFIDNDTEDCNSNPAAIEAVVVNDNAGVVSVGRSVFDVEDRANGFTILSKGANGFRDKTFCGQATGITIASSDVELRVRPLYSATTIGVEPVGGSFAAQFQLIRSEGTAGDNVTKVVEVQRGNPQAPSIFDYALFSGGNIEK